MRKSKNARISRAGRLVAIAAFAMTACSAAAETDLERKQAAKIRQLEVELAKLKGTKTASESHRKKVAVSSSIAEASAKAPADDAVVEKKSEPQSLFLRKNKLETSLILYRADPPPDAKGASFSWTKDYLANTDTLNLQSYLTWVPPGFSGSITTSPDRFQSFQLSNWALAPFSYLVGKLTDPFKKTERSAAQFGLNGGAGFSGGQPFSLVVANVQPYYQTDFRGYAEIYGFDAYVEPYQPDWRLGAAVITRDPTPVDWYWRFIAEANPVRVDKRGLTNFEVGNYDFLGGTTQVRAVLFANMPSVPTELCGRISLLGSYQFYWEAVHRDWVQNWHGEIDYDFSGKTTATRYCSGPSADPPAATSPSLQTSLAITYDNGVDKTTLTKTQQLGATLTLLY